MIILNISGFQKLTLTDFPEKVACIIFTQGCNFKCPFCQNSDLLDISKDSKEFTEDDIFKYLIKRKNILDGVVITGGEPLMQPDLKDFIKKIKDLKLQVKLDTNGSSPDKLEKLIKENLLDYIAMDIKNDNENYQKTVGIRDINLNNIYKSIDIIKNSNIKHEFRTTIAKELHTYDNIYNICKIIGNNEIYYLQNFEDSQGVINHNLHSFSKEELKEIEEKLIEKYPNVKIRGL